MWVVSFDNALNKQSSTVGKKTETHILLFNCAGKGNKVPNQTNVMSSGNIIVPNLD